ncbi:multidrug effflux MFS transporter [Coralliovum pocilloporae]|uniref:multidrug effflux MFS transporter n=1 Tax=Coralliovum pocilloporae TaxID=3066369 RepID=UPI0033074D69
MSDQPAGDKGRVGPGFAETVSLLALLTSLVALSIDAMLPALQEIGQDLGTKDPNDNQLIVIVLFLGMAIGQILYGPLSDSFGRKRPIYAGLGIFMLGSLLSFISWDFQSMLLGRFLQGLGAAGPRIVAIALVRDQYEGRAMARLMSFVMAVFILVPAIAPALGQGILLFADWRAIFLSFVCLAMVVTVWFFLRQDETLAQDKRLPFSLSHLVAGLRDCLSNRVAVGYILAAGFVFGAFIGYLSTAQQIFQQQYELGEKFPLFFAVLALAIGAASLVNARLVMKLGMRYLSMRAVISMIVLSTAFTVYAALHGDTPPLWIYMLFFSVVFFCIGLLFGNFNALAMEPLGHIAGLASAVIGSLTTFISLGLGMVIGQAYDGTVVPLVAGFAILSCAALAAMVWADRTASR